MKKIILVALSVILFVGCDDTSSEPKATPPKATTETSDIHTEAIKDAKSAVEALKEQAVESTKEVTKAIEPVTKKVVEVTKEIKEEATKVLGSVVEDTNSSSSEKNDTVVVVDGSAIYKKCSACHGEDGKKSAFAKSEIIAGQNVDALIVSITEYKAGTRDVSGMGKLMKGQVTELSEAEIKAVSEYISTL